MKKIFVLISMVIAFTLFIACEKDPAAVVTGTNTYKTTPYILKKPGNFPNFAIPADNPMTVEGVALGRKLFYDPILSANNTQACGSCHNSNFAFTDSTLQFSKGITGEIGTRNAMPIMNLAWEKKFFWDGGAATLEDQVIGPITNPVEMHETLPNVLAKLNNHPEYPKLFKNAFGTDSITSKLLMKAIAQFERTLISANSKYDQFERGEVDLSIEELEGKAIFEDMNKGDCNHCHVTGSTFTDFDFKNNAIDSVFKDKGRYKITLDSADLGKFKTPSLRNIELTAPYMHDGRFKTLEEVVEHYNSNFHITATTDVNIKLAKRGRMTEAEKGKLILFLKTLTDRDFINNPDFKKP